MNRFSNILFVANLEADDTAAFNQAITVANNNQAKLTVVGLVNDSNLPSSGAPNADELLEELVEQRRAQLQEHVESVSTKQKIEVKVLVGKAFMEIVREVLRFKRDLVIKSVWKTNLRQQLFGSTDMKILRKCPCPVWLIKSTQQQGYRQILVGLDYKPENAENDALNQQLLEMASYQALADSSELHIIHAWRLEYESFLRSPRTGHSDEAVDAMVQEEENKRRRWLQGLVAQYCGKLGEKTSNYLDPQLHLIQGDAKKVVLEYAKDLGAELVVLGTVGRTGLPGFIIGNTAEAILNRLDSSVLAAKPPGFISPVTLE